ncbi:MAG: peroxiredoxin [Candidatus Micrarchaeia archaeon]
MQSIEIGENVPDINARAWFPEKKEIAEFNMSKQKGRWTILTFYPGDFTFVCATDLEALTERYDDFKKNGADVFAISTDTVYSHKMWSETSPRVKNSPIPLVEDHKKEISSAFGFLNSKTGSARRGLVIIDPQGRLQYYAQFNDALGKDINHVYYALMGLKYISEAKEADGHICVIPANWKIGEKALDIDVVNDIGKL